MDAIICDRCKKIIGEKTTAKPVLLEVKLPPGTDMQRGAAKATGGKTQQARKLALCETCGKMQEAFLKGDEDLRTDRQKVHPASIIEILNTAGVEYSPSNAALAEQIINSLPNGGVF